jgi:hypothetical protein
MDVPRSLSMQAERKDKDLQYLLLYVNPLHCGT